MSIYLELENGDQVQVASNKGWGDLCRWVDGLDDSYDQLLHLVTYGWVSDALAMKHQFQRAIGNSPPEDHTVSKTIKGLLRSIKNEGSVIVSIGMKPDGEEET